MAGGAKLTRHQEQAIAALLSEPTHDSAAAKVGVNPSTLTRWLQQAEFRNAYRQARSQILEGVIATLLKHCGSACTALRRNLKATKPSDQIKAALGILTHAMRGSELLDLAARMEAVEQALQTPQHGGVNNRNGRVET